MLEALIVHDQHDQINAFNSNLQSPTSPTNGDERGRAPAFSCAAAGHTTSMLAAKYEATLDQVWHYPDVFCIAHPLLRDPFVWSCHDGMQNFDGRLQARN